MTAYEEWLTKLVDVLVGDAPGEASSAGIFPLSIEDCRRWNATWRKLEQRFAIGLTQARAIECRHLAGELAVGGANHPVAVQIMRQLWERSHKLEAIGLMLAQPDGWPIQDGHEALVCRCAIDHGEVDQSNSEEFTTAFVCAHCKLPKHGSDAQPDMVIQ